MWALVENNTTFIKLITSAVNVVAGDGSTISNIRLLSKADRVAIGIYDYVENNALQWYEKETSRGYVVDQPSGTVTMTIVTENKPVAQLKDVRAGEVQRIRSSILRSGTTISGFPVSTQTDEINTYLLMSATLSLGGRTYPPGGVDVLLMDGTRANLNETQFTTLVDGLAQHFFAADGNADTHITAIEALVIDTDVINYDITTGWPATVTPIGL